MARPSPEEAPVMRATLEWRRGGGMGVVMVEEGGGVFWNGKWEGGERKWK